MADLDASRFVYVVSIAVHVIGGLALAAVKTPEEKVVEVIEMQTVDLPKPKPKPPEPPPPEAPPAPAPKAAPTPKPAAPEPEAAPEPPPDFGFALGAADGPGGIAVAAATPKVVTPPTQTVKKALSAPKVAPEDSACTDADTKAKAVNMPHPAYTDAARTAGIEGKVRVELSVDETGAVTAARVLEGLGSGLDEAALDAVKQAQFSPATHCGKPVASTFTVAIRFAL